MDLAGDVNLDNEKRKRWNDIAYSFLDFTKNDSLIRRNLYVIGINNANLTRFDRLRENARDLSDLSIKSNNEKSTADSYKLRGLYFMYKSENEKAVECFYKAKKIFLKLKAYRRLIAINKDIAQVQNFSNDFLGSNKTLFENLKKIKKELELNGDSSKTLNPDLFRNYTAIASNFASLNDYRSSILFEKRLSNMPITN
ncbi:MAG: hypothetical protein M0D53_07920 [Flavobacterium sp. JAD_PAG50586_2]|nr:MAG: hypothetical protein M0D53_07920 [Flavobacterium sp. JAD_PAG50586_2]